MNEIQTKAGADANIILAGDFNDVTATQSVFNFLQGHLLDAAVVTDMQPSERYTAQYQSMSIGLDHMFISPSLGSPSAGFEYNIIHINSWRTAREGRVSDHDPIIARYRTCRQNAPDHEVAASSQPPANREVQPLPEEVTNFEVVSLPSNRQVENEWQVQRPRRLPRPSRQGKDMQGVRKQGGRSGGQGF